MDQSASQQEEGGQPSNNNSEWQEKLETRRPMLWCWVVPGGPGTVAKWRVTAGDADRTPAPRAAEGLVSGRGYQTRAVGCTLFTVGHHSCQRQLANREEGNSISQIIF